MRRDDDEERSGEAGGASWVDKVVIPDDISELDAEVRALRRERRVQRRRSRLRRLTGTGGTTGPLLMVAILLIAGMAGLLVLFQPRRTAGTATALGNAQTSDQLLPDVLVTLVDNTRRSVRDFRPGVFALAPIGCDCDGELAAAGAAAHRHNVTFFLVDRTLPPLPAGLTEATTTRLVEPTGTIAERYAAEKNGHRVGPGPVLVLVNAGGQIQRVLPQATPRTLESELTQLVPQAAAAS
ncbi:MAG TPA: hypothetical protein VLM05_09485 [Mycobacteriales bacterium]|nr:hypothetical protein [Mycobacteriales bacterium]